MYLHVLRTSLSQGDIFTRIDLIDSAAPTSPLQQHNVIVFSHTCEILKPSNAIVLVCAIRPLSIVNSSLAGMIKKNMVYNTMYIDPTGTLTESFIDFRCIFRVNKLLLEKGINRNLRIASFDDEAQLALTTFFYRFLVRKMPVG